MTSSIARSPDSRPSTARSSCSITTPGFRSPTIAEVVGVPVGTVKSRLHHATRSLRASVAIDSILDTAEIQSA